jgi:hypothetical protein
MALLRDFPREMHIGSALSNLIRKAIIDNQAIRMATGPFRHAMEVASSVKDNTT